MLVAKVIYGLIPVLASVNVFIGMLCN